MIASPTPLPLSLSIPYYPSVLPYFTVVGISDKKKAWRLIHPDVLDELLRRSDATDVPRNVTFPIYKFKGKVRTKTVLEGKAKGWIAFLATPIVMNKFIGSLAFSLVEAYAVDFDLAVTKLYSSVPVLSILLHVEESGDQFPQKLPNPETFFFVNPNSGELGHRFDEYFALLGKRVAESLIPFLPSIEFIEPDELSELIVNSISECEWLTGASGELGPLGNAVKPFTDSLDRARRLVERSVSNFVKQLGNRDGG